MARARCAAIMVLVLAAAVGCGGAKADVAPVADIVCSTIALVGDQVILDASQSTDDDRDTLQYLWQLTSVPEGSALASEDIVNGDKAVAAVTFEAVGDYTILLTVTDRGGKSSTDNRDIAVSIVCIGAPATPTGLTVGGATSSSLNVSWDPNPCATSYQLYRDTDAGGAFAECVYDAEATSFTDDGLAPGTTCWYKVRASRQFASALSEAVSGTITGTPDTTPPLVSTFVVNLDVATSETAAVTLTIEVSDVESGMRDMQFSNDFGVTWSEWMPYASTAEWTLSTGDEPKSVSGAFRNKALLIQNASDTITLDEWRTVRVMFVKVSVRKCGDFPGPGQWYWSFAAVAGDQAYPVDDVPSDGYRSLNDFETYTVGASQELTVPNSAVSSVGVQFWAKELDGSSSTDIANYSATYPYPGFGVGSYDVLLGPTKGPCGYFYWQIDLLN